MYGSFSHVQNFYFFILADGFVLKVMDGHCLRIMFMFSHMVGLYGSIIRLSLIISRVASGIFMTFNVAQMYDTIL